jgi:TonB-linked SusC/RagA family outer membrane protein
MSNQILCEIMKKNNFLRLFFLLFLSAVFSLAQGQEGHVVRGTVTSASDGMPLPGVNIIIKGTTTGTITNVDGIYEMSLNNPDEAVLVFKFIGFNDMEVPVENQSTINAQLEESVIGLDEVVAIGYGTVSKRDLTGSVGSLDAEMVTEKGTTSPLESIQGAVAGVQISSNTGRIGDGFSILIRGRNTMSDDNIPLYVVDGVVTDGIDFLNPQDIARIDILKDASSTAIYGSRGTNGVVIVTTKQGSDSKSKAVVTYDGYYGVKTPARLPEMMDGEKWWYYHKSAYLATASDSNEDGIIDAQEHEASYLGTANSELLRRAQANETTDWYDEVLKNGKQQNHYVSISGASENVSYVMGIGYQNEEGNLNNEYIDKYTFKTSVNHKVSEKVTAGASLNVSLTEQVQCRVNTLLLRVII